MSDDPNDTPPVEPNPAADSKKAAREAIKARYANRRKSQTKVRKPLKTGKLIDYDSLPPEQQLKYFAENGTLQFLQLTGERTYPQWVIDRAFELYADGLTLESIAVKWDVEQSVVNKWARSQSWQRKLDKIKEAVEERITKEKVKKVVSKRQELDERHTQIIQGIIAKTAFELERVPRADEDPKIFEFRQNTRMKTLKIAYEVFRGCIDTERLIVGITNEQEGDSSRLPSSFEFVIKTTQGQSVDDLAALKAALPSQDPHSYIPGDENAALALSEPKQDVLPPRDDSQAIQPIVMAPDGVVGRQESGPIQQVVDPVRINQFGAIDTGPATNPAWQQATTDPLGVFGDTWLRGGY